MLADLDDPPKSRWPSLLFGVVIAVPLAGSFLFFALPALRQAIVGGSQSLDARLRQEDAYMKTVCAEALVLERDEQLCKCAMAVEFPSLDCQAPFHEWTLHRQHEQCQDPVMGEQALSFCACVNSLEQQIATPEIASDPKKRRQRIARYSSCTELSDALFLPPIEALIPEAISP